MGNRNAKSSLRNAIIYLNISADEISGCDEKFWAQIFSEDTSVADDVLRNITVQEIRMLRDGSPRNFALLTYKMVERLCLSTGTLCNTQSQQTAVLNSIKTLVRMLPCIFEDPPWRKFLNDNYLLSASESAQGEPVLHYPRKAQDERNYAAYVPAVVGSRSATPTGVTDCASKHGVTLIAPQVGNLLHDEKIYNKDRDDNCTQDSIETRPTSVGNVSLMEALILSICDLLFCPEFTVLAHGDSYLANAVDGPPDDLKSLSTYDYVWEPGVGFDSSVNSTTHYDKNRCALLGALLVCLSTTLYELPDDNSIESHRNECMDIFVGQSNRHALPLFTSLLNVVFGYKQPRALSQLNSLLFESDRERLVELSSQLLIAVLDHNNLAEDFSDNTNLFIDYLSRIHREEDFAFLIKGFIRLANDGLEQGYLWTPTRHLEVDQELQVLLWKVCNTNKKFLQYLLASNELLGIVVPILYHLNENFQETSKTALIHIGVFNLLVLSGERNFGVRLNKPYTANFLGNLPDFQGTHADLIIVVFHKLIMYGYKINQLYDYLLAVLVNISPYLKGTTILACRCMMQLFETFSSVLVIFTEPNYHQLVISLLEVFNNLIQYQFDGNANLVYTILAKKETFVKLASLSTSQKSIDKVLRKLWRRKQQMEQLDGAKSVGQEQDSQQDKSGLGGSNTLRVLNSEPELDISLAIVSCTSTAMTAGPECKRHEVSLVATPDLHLTTHAINPLDPGAASPAVGNGSCVSPEPKMSLDDLLLDPEELGPDAAKCNRETDSAQPSSTTHVAFTAEIDLLHEPRTRDTRPELDGADQSELSDSPPSNPWRPTSDWLRAWKRTLPLQTILRMICALEPQVEQFKRTSGRGADEQEIVKFLQNGTLVGLLPVPHPIQIRKYRTDARSALWFRTYTWGIIYVRNRTWMGTDIKLINIL